MLQREVAKKKPKKPVFESNLSAHSQYLYSLIVGYSNQHLRLSLVHSI